jgi:S-adenosylmethionine hydrolase
VFLAVVDPGVGSGRKAVALATPRFACVGPDNGIFTYLLAGKPDFTAVEVRQAPVEGRPAASATFHGRDVFAPAAARLWAGTPLAQLGPAAAELVRLPLPRLEAREDRGASGEVLAADRFGNAITSIGALRQGRGFLDLEPWLPGSPRVRLTGAAFRVRLPGGTEAPLVRTYSDVQPGWPLAYIGSDGLLEIGVNRGRAVDLLPLARGAAVELQRP